MRRIMRPVAILILAVIMLLATGSVASASTSPVGGYGPGGHGNSKGSGGHGTPPSGCTSNCSAPPNPPSCSFVSTGGYGSSSMPSGAPGTLYTEQCSSACIQSGGSVSCAPPSAPCTVPPGVGVGLTVGGGSATAVDCPVGGSTTSWSEQYGYSASPGSVCVSRWVVTYGSQSYSTVPAGCSSSLSMPANYFRQSCTNAPTTATVQYWLQLPTISPPSGWAVAAWPPGTYTSDGGTSYPDGSGATIGPYAQTVSVPACPIYQGKSYATKYVMDNLNAGNGLHGGTQVLFGTNPHGVTLANGFELDDDGSVHHYVFGFQFKLPQGFSSVGVDPYLRWEGGTASIANITDYPYLHDMWGQWLPAWDIHFSSLTAGDGACSSALGHPYCNSPGVTSNDPNWSPWALASQWAYWPSSTAPATYASGVAFPKIVADFEIHEPTVVGMPIELQLNGTMQASWFYNHFSISATVSGTTGNTSFSGTQPETETTTNTTTSNNKKTCASPNATPNGNGWCTITTTGTQTITVSQTFGFVYPASVSLSPSVSALSPGPAHTSAPFPVQATADIQGIGAFLCNAGVGGPSTC
jgi:hypothetical protein